MKMFTICSSPLFAVFALESILKRITSLVPVVTVFSILAKIAGSVIFSLKNSSAAFP